MRKSAEQVQSAQIKDWLVTEILTDELLSDQIVTQGQLVRQLKAEKKEKSVTDAEVKKLLDLKARYKEETGKCAKRKLHISNAYFIGNITPLS